MAVEIVDTNANNILEYGVCGYKGSASSIALPSCFVQMSFMCLLAAPGSHFMMLLIQ